MLLSAFFWSYALMQIPMGVLADRVNLRWLYAVAFALWSVSQGLIGLATGLGTLIAFRVLLGVGEAIYLPGGSKIVSLLFRPSERGLPSGLFDAGTRTGLVMEGVLVPWMLTRYGWRTTFAVVGFSALRVADPVVRGRTARSARDGGHPGRDARTDRAPPGRARHEPQSDRHLRGVLLLRLLLVLPRELAARLPRDGAGAHAAARRASTPRCRISCSGRASRSEAGSRIGS